MMDEQPREETLLTKPCRFTRRQVLSAAGSSLFFPKIFDSTERNGPSLLGLDPEPRSRSNHLTKGATRVTSTNRWVMPYYEWLSKDSIVANRGTREDFFTTDMVSVDVTHRRVAP